METETVTELTEEQSATLEIRDRLRAMSFDVIPSTIVCGMAGISEGAYRVRLKQGQLRTRFVHFGLRIIQVVPVEDVIAVFFPDGPDEEVREELAFGFNNDSLIISDAGHCFRVLFAGFTDMGIVKRTAMAKAYKHGKGRAKHDGGK